MKFGLHVGGQAKYLNPSTKNFVLGRKNSLVFLDLNHTLTASRRIIFLLRKILLKKEILFSPTFFSNKNYTSILRLFRYKGKNKNGFLSNREFTKKKIKISFGKRYLRSRLVFLGKKEKTIAFFSKRKYRRYSAIKKLPSVALFPRLEGNLYSVLESRKKKILSVLFTNSDEKINVAHYSVLANNRSGSSLHYFYRVFHLGLAK